MTPPRFSTYSEEEIRHRLAVDFPGWEYDGGWIRRDFPTRSWARTLEIVNRIAYLAEAARHHPDLEIRRHAVRLRIRHHWAGGITESDFEFAREIQNALPL